MYNSKIPKEVNFELQIRPHHIMQPDTYTGLNADLFAMIFSMMLLSNQTFVTCLGQIYVYLQESSRLLLLVPLPLTLVCVSIHQAVGRFTAKFREVSKPRDWVL